MVGKRQENSYTHDLCMCMRNDNNAHDIFVCGWENNNVILLCACACDVLMCKKITHVFVCITMLFIILLPSNLLRNF